MGRRNHVVVSVLCDDRAREKERQANDWRTFNEKTIKQAKTGLFIQNLCETEHPGDYERAGIFILESRRDLGRLYEMAPVRILHYSLILLQSRLRARDDKLA